MAIPIVPVKETVWPVAGDNTANIQAAIDKVSALPLDRYAFRGSVLLRAGYYRMATPILIQASGVVLRALWVRSWSIGEVLTFALVALIFATMLIGLGRAISAVLGARLFDRRPS